MKSNPDYYEILQVSPTAESEVIQAVYRRLARKYHPDTTGNEASAEKMKLLNEAYAVLSDPVQRKAYDQNFPRQPAAKPKRTDKTLIFTSDLCSERESWLEGADAHCETDRRGGWFHLVVTRPNWASERALPVTVSNFEMRLKVQFPRKNGRGAECGLFFRKSRVGFYKFAVWRDGYYGFSARVKDPWVKLIDHQHSDLFEDEANSLMVKAVGRKIKLGVNGQLLASLQDDRFAEGQVGFYVATGENETFAQARFRDLQVYSIQSL